MVVAAAQPMVRPSQTVAVVSTRSTTYSTRYSSGIDAALGVAMWLRLKPVAIRWSSVGLGSRSPASCSMVNRSNGMLRVERVDDPVAPRPHVALGVGLVAVGVGVAGRVEPVERHPLAVARRGEQAIDDLLVGVRRRVGEEGVDSSAASAAGRSGRA